MQGKIILLLFFFMVTVPVLAFAHEGGHEEKNHSSSEIKNDTPLNDSIYSVDGEKNTELPIANDLLNSSLLSSGILNGEDPLTDVGVGIGEPMIRFEDKVDPKRTHSQHEQQKQHVEKSTHEWVSLDAKGHGIAIGITIISGLAFVALSFFRIGE